MKKMLLLLLSFILLLACVPTPEEEIVVNKGNQNEMIELSQEEVTINASPSESAETARLDYAAAFGIPAHLTLELPIRDGVHQVSIDADIITPEAALPVVRVFPGAFDQTLVTAFWDTLIGDTVMYRDDSMTGARRQPTKAEIAEDLKTLYELIDQPARWSDRMFASREEIETEIEELKTAYQTAPDDVPPREIATGLLETETLTLEGTSETAHRIGLHAYTDDYGSYTSFLVENNSDNSEPILAKYSDGWGAIGTDKHAKLSYHRKSITDWTNHNNVQRIVLHRNDPIPEFLQGVLTVTPDEAAGMLEAVLRAAGVDDILRVSTITAFYGPYHNDETRTVAGYELSATRYVNGVPMNPLGGVGAMSEDRWSRSYTPYWQYETVDACVDNDGIYSFRWSGLLALSDTITQISSLMPFSRMQETLEARLPITEPCYSWTSDLAVTEAHTHITEIRLGLWLVREQNEFGKGLLVPCYCLYGTYSEQREGVTRPYRREGLLYVVNAVDGSLIDPQKGY